MKKIIVANWKMYLTLSQSTALAGAIRSKLSFVQQRRTKLSFQLVLCPSFIALEEVAKVIRGTRIKLGAQDVEPEKRGAYTGEVGLDDLRELGVEYVLVGHSERRRYFKETDAVVNQKLRAVLKAGMKPILCVGEPWSVRRVRGEKGARRFVEGQLKKGLKGVALKDLKRVAIAYEPVWAIGTGRPDTPKDASKMHGWIQKVVGGIYGGPSSGRPEDGPRTVPVLYGGSVSAKNAAAFLHAPGVDGLLIGKASTRAAEFKKIKKIV